MITTIQLPSDRPSVPPRPGLERGLRRRAFPALGTTCELQFFAPDGDAQATGFEQAAVAWVQAFEAKYSRFRPDSLVSRITAAAGRAWIEVDDEMSKVIAAIEGAIEGIIAREIHD